METDIQTGKQIHRRRKKGKDTDTETATDRQTGR